jgi:hypothetical protein
MSKHIGYPDPGPNQAPPLPPRPQTPPPAKTTPASLPVYKPPNERRA